MQRKGKGTCFQSLRVAFKTSLILNHFNFQNYRKFSFFFFLVPSQHGRPETYEYDRSQ